MSDIANSVNNALKNCQSIEDSSFYQEFQEFSKQYDSLILAGFTQRRKSLLKTIQDQENISPFSYNTIK